MDSPIKEYGCPAGIYGFDLLMHHGLFGCAYKRERRQLYKDFFFKLRPEVRGAGFAQAVGLPEDEISSKGPYNLDFLDSEEIELTLKAFVHHIGSCTQCLDQSRRFEEWASEGTLKQNIGNYVGIGFIGDYLREIAQKRREDVNLVAQAKLDGDGII